MSHRSVVIIVVAVLAVVPTLAAPQQSRNVARTTFVTKKGGEALLD